MAKVPDQNNGIGCSNELDQSLTAKFLSSHGEAFAQTSLYFLRKQALDHALEPYELDRVFFHLSQRRGFKSNRKESKKTTEKEDQGQVKAEIGSLRQKMEEAEARTLGEFLSWPFMAAPHACRASPMTMKGTIQPVL